MDQLLEEDFAVAAKNRLYQCLDRIDQHRAALFTHLQARWKDLFGATYDLLLYDLTSTYFEGQMEQAPKAKHGYSRDKRSDCRQVVFAVVLSAEGFALAYGRELVTPRYSQPEAEHRLVLEKPGWDLPPQPPPRIRRSQVSNRAKGRETKSKMQWRPFRSLHCESAPYPPYPAQP